jgi:PAS domain S-box-containing protein
MSMDVERQTPPPPAIKILVVDDHQENLVALSAVLGDGQQEVVTASSGMEALRLLLRDEFAVILLDVQMPELDGFETARLIRERARSRHTPIVFLTAINTDRTHVARGYSLGAVAYLFKPFDPEILKAKVASFVELARKTQALEAEVRQRELAEEEVRALNLELEDRVLRRTTALRSANRDLRAEIAERNRAEAERAQLLEALVASEERYRALADAMPQLVWTADQDGDIDYVNQRWVEYTGLSQSASSGEGWLTALHPDDAAPTVERWKDAVSTGEVYEVGCRCRRASDGMYRWHLARALPQRDSAGRICRWLGTFTDIEDQKRFEDSLQFLAESSRLLAQSLEYEASLVQVARLAVPWVADWCIVDLQEPEGLRRLAMVHVDPDKEQLAWETWETHPHLDGQTLGPAGVLKSGIPELAAEVSPDLMAAITGDAGHGSEGAFGLCSYLAVPVFGRGRVMGVFTFLAAESRRRYGPQDLEIAMDLARRVGFAVDNARLFREVQEAGHAKDRFLAMLGHELRNPLAPIRNAAAAMRARGLQDPGMERSREIIERQAGHLTRMVDDLLDVARITQGKIDLQRRTIDFCRVIQHSVETVKPAISERGHRLRVTLTPEPIWIEADPTRLEQVLTNLLNNAVRYTAPGGKICLKVCRELTESGEVAVLRLRDTGVGIPPEVLPSIFEPFAQAERSPDRSLGGLGLGLTVVRRLIELHGGTVEARSPGTGQGSEFEVRLPITMTAPELEPVVQRTVPVRSDGPPLARVLVVDDNRDAAETLSELLCLWGYEVQVSEDGESALTAAQAFRPELVLLDIGLPGIDGYSVAERLRARQKAGASAGKETAPLILVAVTGYGQAEDRRRSSEAGFDHHLAKPVDPETLRELLSREVKRLPRHPLPAAVSTRVN